MRGTGVWLACVLCGVLTGAVHAAEPVCPKIPLPPNGLVVVEGTGDVTGDGVADRVLLVGVKTDVSPFAQRHSVLILDGKTGAAIPFSLGEGSGGYDGTLFLGRINPDRAADILIGVPTGGSGGTVNYYLVTAEGGKPAYLIDPQRLDAGPTWRVTLQNGYRARVTAPSFDTTATLDLRASGMTGAELAQTYRNVYDASGRLLTPTSGMVDSYSEMEPVDVNRDGLYELVGYQSIWAVFHANTIGIARSVWRWAPGGLKINSVDVLPDYDPEQYRQAIRQLANLAPATSMPRAIALYRQHFPPAPPFWRNEAFQGFRTFHQAIILRERTRFSEQIATAQTQLRGGSFSEIERLAAQFNAAPANRAAGLQAVYVGEGFWEVRPRSGFYTGNFGAYLTPDYREFLALENQELHSPWAMDAALVISLTALGTRMRAWESYLERYPDAPFRTAAWQMYTAQQTAFLYGINNTPHFAYDTNRMRPGVAEVLQRYVAVHPDTASGRETAQVLALYRQANWIMSETLARALQVYREQHDPARGRSYFPATVGDTWSYATGGAGNAGYRIRVQYREGNRVQVHRQDTAMPAIAIYELSDDRVTLMNQIAGTDANRLQTPDAMREVVLQGPVRAGISWDSNGIRHTVAMAGGTVTVLGHPYINAIEVVRVPLTPGDRPYEIHEYYAVGMGMVRRDEIATGRASQSLLCTFLPASTEQE